MKSLSNLSDKAERKRIYELAMELACEDSSVCFGWCYYLHKVMMKLGYSHFDSKDAVVWNSKKYLPEFHSIRPKGKLWIEYWWPCTEEGWKTRIDKMWNKVILKM